MSDETFAQDFVWYEWSFIAPEDLHSEDLEVTSSTGDSSFGAATSYVQEPGEVWHTYV